MQLSKEALEKFKEAYQKDFGKTIICDAEAKEMAIRLLRLGHIITRPIPENKREEMKKIGLEYKDFLLRLCKDCKSS